MIQGWYYLHINGSMIYKRELGGIEKIVVAAHQDFAKAKTQ